MGDFTQVERAVEFLCKGPPSVHGMGEITIIIMRLRNTAGFETEYS